MLAHVPVLVRSTVFDSVYIAWAESKLGRASERTLAEDASALAALCSTDDALIAAQLLAWAFEEVPDSFDRALADHEVAAARQLVQGPYANAAELLFCAAGLEAEAHRRLGPTSIHPDLAAGLQSMEAIAPDLGRHSVQVVRSLRMRGRVRGTEIWIGAPSDDLALPVSFVLWQAAHEATVAELWRRGVARADVEHAAIVLLAERARRAGCADDHTAWLVKLTAPSPDIALLAEAPKRRVVEALTEKG